MSVLKSVEMVRKSAVLEQLNLECSTRESIVFTWKSIVADQSRFLAQAEAAGDAAYIQQRRAWMERDIDSCRVAATDLFVMYEVRDNMKRALGL